MEDQINQEPQCNCGEEFITTPCPVHGVQAKSERYENDAIVVTDADLAPEVYGTYEGYKFICPVCKLPSIIVNPLIKHRCLECGKDVIVRSRTFTDHIRQRQLNGGA